MTSFLQDLRVALRSMLKTRGFTATAVFTLALGMALSATAVAVMNAYLLHDLPYPSADRLYSVRYGVSGQPEPRGMEALDWDSLEDVIEHPIAWDLDAFYLVGGEHAETFTGAWVTPGFIRGLGIVPALGRGFDAGSFADGSRNVVLISHRLWNARFGADAGVVGRSFAAYVSDRPQEAEQFTIIGVLPASFWHINAYTDIFAPLRAKTYPYLVRLRAGATPQQAASRIAALVRGGARDLPANWYPELISTHDQYVGRTRPMLWTATAAASLVLLVACANVAALLLVRAVGRQKEIAVRLALGARRGAIARMLLAEAMVLGIAATCVAVVATWLALGWLAPIVQRQLGRPAPGGSSAFAVDGTTLTFIAGVGLFTTFICTLAPLLTATHAGFGRVLHSTGRGATEAPRSRRVRATLIALEIAVSLTLLAGSTLMVRTVVALLQTDLGFTTERVLLTSIALRQNRYPDAATRSAVFERMESRIGSVAGVETVGLTTAWPVQQPRLQTVESAERPGAAAQAGVHRVTVNYFSAVGIPPAEGRLFTSADRFGSEPVAVVSETLARRIWPAGDALGARILVPHEQDAGSPALLERVVVGIVRDVRQGPSDIDLSDVYVPILQSPGRFTFVLVRTAGEPLQWVPQVRTAFGDIDPEISVQPPRPLQVLVDELVARPRFVASLLGAFASIAAALALVGVYGVMAYAIRQREREIAVRMALGAEPSRLTRHFLHQGSRILFAGLALGVMGAIGAGRLIESQLFGVGPRDPLALAAAVSAFALAGLLAIWWPSRRAASADPAAALRQE